MLSEKQKEFSKVSGFTSTISELDGQEENLSNDAIVASNTELFIKNNIAPRLITQKGKMVVLTGYLMFTLLCLARLQNFQVYFSFDLFMNEGYKSFEYF